MRFRINWHAWKTLADASVCGTLCERTCQSDRYIHSHTGHPYYCCIMPALLEAKLHRFVIWTDIWQLISVLLFQCGLEWGGCTEGFKHQLYTDLLTEWGTQRLYSHKYISTNELIRYINIMIFGRLFENFLIPEREE